MDKSPFKRTSRGSSSPIKDVPRRLQVAVSDVELRDEIARQFREVEALRVAMLRLLLNDLRAKENEREAENNYTLPGFAEHQADCNGTIRTLRKVIKDLLGVDTYGRTSEIFEQENKEEEI